MNHEQIIDDLVNRVKDNADELNTNCRFDFIINNEVISGEYDLVAVFRKQSSAYVIEVKGRDSIHNRQKAERQLSKDVVFLKSFLDIDRFFCFYAYGRKRSYDIELVKIVRAYL